VSDSGSDDDGDRIIVITLTDGGIGGEYDPVADVNSDDRVISLDALMILQAVAGAIEL